MRSKNEKEHKTKFEKVLSLVSEKEVFALAVEFELAASTIEGWGRGKAIPDQELQEKVLKFLRSKK